MDAIHDSVLSAPNGIEKNGSAFSADRLFITAPASHLGKVADIFETQRTVSMD
jgi:hypothetical protein